MNADVKAKWLEALRSGEYQQAAGQLRDGNAFCCLGVLCDLASQSGAVRPWEGNGIIEDYGATLPPKVMDWAGLDNDNPQVRRNGHLWALGELNDNRATFAEIADVIERDL